MNRILNKPLNAVIAGYSYLRSSLTGQPVSYGLPPAIGIELTNICNLNCPECVSGSGKMIREKGFMHLDLFEKILNELGPYLYNINLFYQGEPMLHPDFFTFLNKSREFHTIVSTNGHFLSSENADRIAASGLNELIVSLDGMDQQTYSAYRVNGDWSIVMQGIKNVSEAIKERSSKLKLIIQVLVSRQNEHQLPEIKKFASAMNASLRLKSMQIINNDSFENRLPSLRKFRRYEKKGENYLLRNDLPNRCPRLWLNPVITWNGKVLPCCFDKDASHIMGDINEDTFRDIWTGPRYRLFRKTILNERRSVDICNNCTSGLKI